MMFCVETNIQHPCHPYPLRIASLAFEAAHFGRASRDFGFADWTQGKLKTVGDSVGVWICDSWHSQQGRVNFLWNYISMLQFFFQSLKFSLKDSCHGFVTIFASSFVCVLCSTAMILLGQL